MYESRKKDPVSTLFISNDCLYSSSLLTACCCRYLMHTLDAYVDMDYSLVYFHFGLTSKNKPPLRWLWEVYKALDRRYKKNLKSLYLVHPTNFIRVVWNFFKPIIRYHQKDIPSSTFLLLSPDLLRRAISQECNDTES